MFFAPNLRNDSINFVFSCGSFVLLNLLVVNRSKVDLDYCTEFYNVNAVGPLRIVKAALDLLGNGTLIVNTSSEAGSLALAAMVLRIIAVANPISNTRFVYNSALRGAGDARFTALSTFLGVALVRPAVAGLLVYVFHMDLTGVWIAMISDALLCYVLGRWRWFSGKWAEIKV